MLWVKISKVQILQGFIEIIVEDDAGLSIVLAVFNQPGTTRIIEDQEQGLKPTREVLDEKHVRHLFKERWEIGIKQPYMVMSAQGYLTLLNANPDNIMFKPPAEIAENHLIAAAKNSQMQCWEDSLTLAKYAIRTLR